MTTEPAITISHVVLHCFDLDKMVDFYTRIMGLRVTDSITIGGPEYTGARLVFLSSDPRDHHQLGLTEGRTAARDSVLLHQVSYRHGSLDRLRELSGVLGEEGVTDIRPVDHGTHWSIYFRDPEGNQIEAFIDTPWYVEPHHHPLDLTLSDDEIMRATKERIKDRPEFKPLSEWRAAFAKECGIEAPLH